MWQFEIDRFPGLHASAAWNMMAQRVDRLAWRIRVVGHFAGEASETLRFSGKAPETLSAKDPQC